MAVYLGTFGQISLLRKSGQGTFNSVVNSSDVNTSQKRFSFDFDTGFLITGDQVEIKSTNGATLSWISTAGWSDGVKYSSGKWYINVDELGGIRIYSTFANAINGGSANAIALDALGSNIPIQVKVANNTSRLLGLITNYELSTQRESIDITALSDQFRSQWSSLMSGSGQITCLWDYKDLVNSGNDEVGNYLLQLAIRTEVGSEFSAQLFLKKPGYNPTGNAGQANDSLYYEIDGVLTATAVQFSTGTIVEMTANFITTGPIRLKAVLGVGDRILQEDTGRILLDQDATANLMQETAN